MNKLQSKSLIPYFDYYVTAKHTLEAKKQEPGFQDFLQVNLYTMKMPYKHITI